MAANSDTDFKQLFALPELARELFCAAMPFPWARRVKPSDLERVNASYVNLDGKQRHDDIVWCIKRGTRPSIYMLVEFQSRPEKLMALRIRNKPVAAASCSYALLGKPAAGTKILCGGSKYTVQGDSCPAGIARSGRTRYPPSCHAR